jgi:predicted CXXCH cytochrome family protein
MKRKSILLSTVAGAAACVGLAFIQEAQEIRFAEKPTEACFESGCHSDAEKFLDIRKAYSGDVHAGLEIDGRKMTCYDCHRIPDEHLEGEVEGKPPRPWEQPALCGKCHSNALVMSRFDPAAELAAEQLFWTSDHGKAQERIRRLVGQRELTEAAGAEIAAGVATCTSCHGVHGIRRVDDTTAGVFPLNVSSTCGRCHNDPQAFKSYFEALAAVEPSLKLRENEIGLLAGAVGGYEAKDNVHREALEERGQLDAPTCNDCHGNHGATPPGTGGSTRVARICGSCHTQSYNDYAQSPKYDIFDNREDRDCYACHTNHRILKSSDTMVGLEQGTICYRCHGDPKEGLAGGETIAAIKGEIERLKSARDEAEETVSEAERKGMDVTGGREQLVQLNTALVTARAKIHRFAVEPVREASEPGFANAEAAKQSGLRALDQLAFRHWGLGLSSLIILVFAIILFLKIRQVDRRDKRESGQE